MDQRVADLMDEQVTVIDKSRDLDDADGMLLREQLQGLPVVDESGRIVGMIGRSDLLAWRARASHATRNGPQSPPTAGQVLDAMSPLVHCIRPDRPVREAAARMIRERVLGLIVVDEAYRVVGMLSATALLGRVPGIAEFLDRERLTGT